MEDIKKALVNKMRSLNLQINLHNLDERINKHTDIEKAFPEIFSFHYSSFQEYEEVIELLQSLWNTYPRKKFDGKSPMELTQMGPQEMALIQSLLSEAAANIDPGTYPSLKSAKRAFEKLKSEWFTKPQKKLWGKTPERLSSQNGNR